MTDASRQTSGYGNLFALFALLAGFANDWMTHSRLRMEILRASRRFSAWLWWSSRGTQLHQKERHPPTNLRQRHHIAAMLPGAVHGFDQRTRRHQLVVCTRHHLCPTFGLLGGPQARCIPQEDLFVQPEAMLVGVAQPIVRTDLGQGSRFVTFPHKPTDSGITRTALGSLADDLDHAHLDLAGLTQMQVLPTAHGDMPAFGVSTLPSSVWFPMGALIAALEACPIFVT